MATRTKKRAVKKPQATASIVWFEVPADDLDRAKKFYGSLFGWNFAKIPAAISDYWHIDTGGKDATPDGGARHVVFRHLSGHGEQYLCPMGDERAR